MMSLRPGMCKSRNDVMKRLIEMQYSRNEIDFKRGTFRAKGDILEIYPSNTGESAMRIEFWGDEIEKISEIKEKISKYSEKRQYERIPKVNIAILSLAMYEALYTEMPVNAAISEAIIIAKDYTYDSDVSFINGILSTVAKQNA